MLELKDKVGSQLSVSAVNRDGYIYFEQKSDVLSKCKYTYLTISQARELYDYLGKQLEAVK